MDRPRINEGNALDPNRRDERQLEYFMGGIPGPVQRVGQGLGALVTLPTSLAQSPPPPAKPTSLRHHLLPHTRTKKICCRSPEVCGLRLSVPNEGSGGIHFAPKPHE
ncbi:hypothetical protein E2C01_080538 [Portunus trituberculatus]|uniref:Uncharacterized protein n=1 Tax=Portunus trituberculatus TaxID=210409 RepID=A0A5B7IYN2_PORTR|nr:hypothetical protein [Portunus trituberculatus]